MWMMLFSGRARLDLHCETGYKGQFRRVMTLAIASSKNGTRKTMTAHTLTTAQAAVGVCALVVDAGQQDSAMARLES